MVEVLNYSLWRIHVPPWHRLIVSKHHPSISRLCPWTCCFLKTSIVLCCSWCMIGSTSLGSNVKLVFLCLSTCVVNMVYWNKSHGSRGEWGLKNFGRDFWTGLQLVPRWSPSLLSQTICLFGPSWGWWCQYSHFGTGVLWFWLWQKTCLS